MGTPHDRYATRTAEDDAPGVRITVRTADRMRELGRRLAALLAPGDLVLLSGELGAGKTTLTRGLGEGLGVRGAVTSPTFVIARVHPSLSGGPALVHVDAYRLGGGLDQMEDLDLDVSLPESVVVVEWGEGKVEELSEARLQVVIARTVGGTSAGTDRDGSGTGTGAGGTSAGTRAPAGSDTGGGPGTDADTGAGRDAGHADAAGHAAGADTADDADDADEPYDADDDAEDTADDVRDVTVTGIGARWAGVDLAVLGV